VFAIVARACAIAKRACRRFFTDPDGSGSRAEALGSLKATLRGSAVAGAEEDAGHQGSGGAAMMAMALLREERRA